jgi:hypothetical protein
MGDDGKDDGTFTMPIRAFATYFDQLEIGQYEPPPK